ncbi:hypothetical protein LTR36_007482 [Oleoguttula mirabilis]|uniref:CRAL-TRIO domain-containing protein n=1 Tax=Oleoguttula mirabilis TaxID=1507867 RepID=A0AAV9JU87_9PEZI|nr:hypothetical protein LTR36_007482 [Oleoguttula mirabilis]
MSVAQQQGAELQRVESYQWPSAHVGHLNENQSGALDRFKTLCEQKGYYVPVSADGKTPATHDDETLLRYLRARKFVPSEAFGQFKDTEDWRKENDLDNLYATIDVDEYEQTRRLYPQWTGRRDRRGIPFYVYEISHVDSKAVSAYTSDKDAKKATRASTTAKTPRKMLRLFALYENLCRFVLPLCSVIPDRPNSETPISQSSNVVDLSKVGITKFWSLRNHMSDASTLATAHYPETLDRIFVVGAPSFFPTVWDWAKKWFDPITVSKIFILSDKNMKETLEKFVDIDNIPKKYGGNLDWQFGDMPYLEPSIVNALRWKEQPTEKGHRTWPKGPIKWQYDDNGDLVATAIGTEHGQVRNRAIAGLHPDAGVAQLALSPGRVHGGEGGKTSTDIATATGAAAVTSPAGATTAGAEHNAKTAGMTSSSAADADQNVGRSQSSAVQGTSRSGTYTVPFRDDNHSQVASPSPDTRQGTSSTRFEQQAGTHAEGTLADGTPETKTDGRGEQQGIMEPGTVGQAPKEHPVPTPEGEEQQGPTMVEQAQQYATQAYEQASLLPGVVMGAVGIGGGAKQEEAVKPVERKEDPAIDNMAGGSVEEFLRSHTMSTAKPMAR